MLSEAKSAKVVVADRMLSPDSSGRNPPRRNEVIEVKKYLLSVCAVIFLAVSLYSKEVRVIDVKASSVEGDKPEFNAENAIDNDTRTRWTSEWKDNEWIMFEFEEPVTLYGIRIKWETAAGFKYDILSSNDGKKWQKAAAVTDGWEGDDRRINFEKKTVCKYIKIDCIERITGWGFSVWEIEFNNKEPYKDAAKKTFFIEGKSFFSIKKKKGKYWFVDPDGKTFISKGVNVVVPEDGAVLPGAKFYTVVSKYDSRNKWAEDALGRLREWGFNTAGCWSDIHTFTFDMPFVVIMNVPTPGEHRLVDLFDEKFERSAEKTVQGMCRRFKDAKYLIGYFIDNELPWYGDVGWYTGHDSTLFDEYVRLPAGSPGKDRVIEFFKKEYNDDINDFNKIWDKDFGRFEDIGNVKGLLKFTGRAKEDRKKFTGLLADRYFSVITKCIRKHDPNHLILGCRFAGVNPYPVVEACGKYCDVISVNYYCKDMKVNRKDFDNIYLSAKKPVLITEFSYRAMENNSGDKNTHGADVTVAAQKDRADGFEKYITQIMDLPYMVGYHWFQYFDQSPQGRSFDGENSNYGIVDIYDREYGLLTGIMKKINAQAEEIHSEGKHPYPEKMIIEKEGYARVADKKVEREKEALYCDLDKISPDDFGKWGDFPKASLSISKKGRNTIVCNFDSGSGWGLGFTVFSTLEKYLNEDKSVDLQGYKGIKIKMSVPDGTAFFLYMNESGAEAPDKGVYKSVKGADGESFSSELFVGTGKVKEYEFDFNSLKVRHNWGNQKGNKTVDLQAIIAMDAYIPGKNGSGIIEIEKVSLY